MSSNGNGAGLSGTVKQVAEHASGIARLEMELALMELKRKALALGLGIGMLVGAGVFLLLFVGFLFATVAAVLATFLSTWLALLIVTFVILAIAGTLGILGLASVRKGSPPVPEQAIEEAKLTTGALKS